MVKVLHIISSAKAEHGGPIEGLIRAGEVWGRHGHFQQILTLDPPETDYGDRSTDRIISVGLPDGKWRLLRRFIPMRRYAYTPAAVPWVRRHAADYDVVVVNGLWNYATLAALRGLKGVDVPRVIMPHGMLDPWFAVTYPLKTLLKRVSWRLIEGPLMNNAQAVFFTAEEEKRLARLTFKPYHPNEMVVAYGAPVSSGDADAQRAAFRALLPALGDRPFLLFLGRIHKKKGCDLLLQAFAKIHAAHPELDLVMAGPDSVGLGDGLKELASRLGIEDRVHWPGMVTGDAKWGGLHACLAFALPSHQENFGISVAEALGCGKPVLISDKVNIWREIEAGGAGYVAPDDSAGTDQLLRRFLALDPVERTEMESRALATYRRNYDVEETAVAYINTLASIVDDYKRKRREGDAGGVRAETSAQLTLSS